MLKSIEAIVEMNGEVRLKEPIRLDAPCRAILTLLDDDSAASGDAARLSEEALGADWNRTEENEAWSHLRPAQQS